MNVKHLLERMDIAPKKSLGQNFLQDSNALEKIANAAQIAPTDTVLEIGAGTGSLTIKLAQRSAQVIAIEIDERLLPILHSQLRDFPNVRLYHADILQVDLDALLGERPYLVVANLPYYITSRILRHLFEARNKAQRLILTVQQEVAERLVAKPSEMSLLSVSAQFYGKPQIVARLSPSAFYPRPEVASAVVRIDMYAAPPVDVPNEEIFFHVVSAGFSQKRKQLKNALSNGLAISPTAAADLLMRAGIDPMRRAETLTLEEWAALTRLFAAQDAHIFVQ
ncbi:MAG: 16S rRNA (adenine(1518)-N(6)/adenine(1519)-N(6))-dimethyltransferase RsmA [Candidatus Thermofonsia Clade 1 bacterium]|uniref:Ribosomal RNA small subunit methyltransferase A n=1 Tax=Candidatus Thermofonsia Clade 1 bacterium TaxID=2364210 RepID=A0A2M8PI51_9CHLR|nr:MAG: 16S rRNA (adenine(1518)-N(6)/adenine(1519)-N(6))-dimethyltransferase RsmA [Candidatus Thermofonsia Clade 1 bacterium]